MSFGYPKCTNIESQLKLHEIIESRTAFSTPWFDVLEKTLNGWPSPYYTVKPLDYVSIFATTWEDQVLLVRQYRPVISDYALELPSGHVESGESPREAAQRELLEETGFVPEKMELLGELIPDIGRLENKMWCFHAVNAAPRAPIKSGEGIELVECSYGQLWTLIRQQKITHALNLAVCALMLLKRSPMVPIS